MHCDRHADVEASRQCQRCAKWHCDACVRKVKAGIGTLDACSHCDGLLRHAPTETVLEGGEAVLENLRRVLGKEGAVMSLAIAVPAFVGYAFSWLVYFVYFAALTAYYFAVVEHVAEGKPGLPGPRDDADDITDILDQLFRGVLVMAVGALPLILWSALGGNTADSPVGDPLSTIALHVLGFVMLPAVILAVVLTGKTAAAVWPFAWAAVIRRAPLPYLKLVGLFTLSSFVIAFAAGGAFFFLSQIPFFGYLLVFAVTNAFIVAQAALLGGFVYRQQLAFRE